MGCVSISKEYTSRIKSILTDVCDYLRLSHSNVGTSQANLRFQFNNKVFEIQGIRCKTARGKSSCCFDIINKSYGIKYTVDCEELFLVQNFISAIETICNCSYPLESSMNVDIDSIVKVINNKYNIQNGIKKPVKKVAEVKLKIPEGEIEAIAKRVLGVQTLEKRWNDDLDFYDLAVWNIKEALEEAYKLGFSKAQKKFSRK